VETAATAAMKAAATATVKPTTATAVARLRYVRKRQPQDCARQDRGKRQRDLFAEPSSHHIFLHPN
jgi:hypothetical protein